MSDLRLPRGIWLLTATVCFVALAAVVALVLTDLKPLTIVKPLPVLGTIEPFSLVERSGKPITETVLKGKISVVDFIFTACPGPCLQLSGHFSEFQKEITTLSDVQLISFSVNPSGDTPAVLSRYADKFGADPARWLFVTDPKGEKTALYNLIEHSFKLAVQENYDPKAPLEEKFIHSTRIVLVDNTGAIRGYYDGLDPLSYVKIKADIQHLQALSYALATPISCPQCQP